MTIRSHVPTDGLLSANALMQMAMMGVRVIGPAAAGALVAAFGASVCYTFDVISFLGSAALIGSVAIVRPPAPPRAVSSNSRVHAVLHDMSEGMRFIVHHAALSFVVMAMAAGLFTIGCFGPLIAVYVREWLHGSSAVFGVVSAMVGAGMMAGTPAVRRFAMHVSHSTLVLAGLAGIGVGALLLGAVPWVSIALLGTFTLGFTFAGIIVPAQTLMQRETPHALMGRISSTVMSVVFFAQLLGLVLSGLLAQFFGVRAVFFLCAVLAWVLTASGWLLLKSSSQPGPVLRPEAGERIRARTNAEHADGYSSSRATRGGGHAERQTEPSSRRDWFVSYRLRMAPLLRFLNPLSPSAPFSSVQSPT